MTDNPEDRQGNTAFPHVSAGDFSSLGDLHDNQASNWVGEGSGGVSLHEYSGRMEVTRSLAQNYVNKYGQKLAPLQESNVTALAESLTQSVVAQTLFIGYLVSACTAHPVEFYSSRGIAYFRIQFSGLVAFVGVCSLALANGVGYAESILRSGPGISKFDGRSIRHEEQVCYVFLKKELIARTVCRCSGLLVQLTFAFGLFIDVYETYRGFLDFTLFFVAGAVVLLFFSSLAINVRLEAQNAWEKMGYKYESCAGGMSNRWEKKEVSYMSDVTFPNHMGVSPATAAVRNRNVAGASLI